MKVAVLTFHRAYNYGAVLQCYALNKKLNQMGNQCETLDYWPSYFRDEYYMEKKFKLSHPPIKTWIRRFIIRDILKSRTSKFEKFINENIPISKQIYHNYEEIEQLEAEYDVFITGSDQVWNNNCTKMDKVFFLDFKQAKEKMRVSYAASFGFKQLPHGLEDKYKKELSGYDYYSVREESGKEIVDKLLNREAVVCCDPTLLLGKEEWEILIGDNKEKEEYILVYYVSITHKIQKYAIELAKKNNCKVIIVPCSMEYEVISGKFDQEMCNDVRTNCSPNEFLTLLFHAKYVLTNSFHGTVFSIIFHKKFSSLTEFDSGKRNFRVENLLSQLGIEDRILSENTVIDKSIDWDDVDARIDIIKNNGMNYLKKITRMLGENE